MHSRQTKKDHDSTANTIIDCEFVRDFACLQRFFFSISPLCPRRTPLKFHSSLFPKDTSAWKRFSSYQTQSSRGLLFPRAMNAVQDLVRGIRQEERVVVTTNNGALRGRYLSYKTGIPGGYYSFQGIRYGKAPVGDRRFKAPLPETPWKGIKPAMREGSSCPHRNMILENYKGNEDCLFLNVYTPKLPDSDGAPKLPVLFWIHGGGLLNIEFYWKIST